MDKKYSSRGLETHTRLSSIQKKHTRAWSIQVVLQEQRCRGEKGELGAIDDADIVIGNRYSDASSSSRLWAHKLGLQDQAYVEQSLLDED